MYLLILDSNISSNFKKWLKNISFGLTLLEFYFKNALRLKFFIFFLNTHLIYELKSLISSCKNNSKLKISLTLV